MKDESNIKGLQSVSTQIQRGKDSLSFRFEVEKKQITVHAVCSRLVVSEDKQKIRRTTVSIFKCFYYLGHLTSP